MKKLVLGIIATVFYSFGTNAQDVSNKNNLYDYVGVQHNEVVKEFIEKYGSENISVEKAIELTTDICKSKGIEGPYLTTEQFNLGMIDVKNNFKETVNNSSLSTSGKKELQTLFDFMLNNGFKGGISLSESIDYFLKFENEIINNKELLESDVVFLLKSASVARHSIGLWEDYYAKNTTTVTAKAEGPRWIRWLVVGAADVAGGMAGGGAFSVGTASIASTAAIEVVDRAK